MEKDLAKSATVARLAKELGAMIAESMKKGRPLTIKEEQKIKARLEKEEK